MGVMPEWDAHRSHTHVCVWDVAAAHLLLEDALTNRTDEVGGEAFLVTGERQAWKIGDVRRAVKVSGILFLHSLLLMSETNMYSTTPLNQYLYLPSRPSRFICSCTPLKFFFSYGTIFFCHST
jgi:hypothetical protein